MQIREVIQGITPNVIRALLLGPLFQGRCYRGAVIGALFSGVVVPGALLSGAVIGGVICDCRSRGAPDGWATFAASLLNSFNFGAKCTAILLKSGI